MRKKKKDKRYYNYFDNYTNKVNIIEYNPIDDSDFEQASTSAIENYISSLE